MAGSGYNTHIGTLPGGRGWILGSPAGEPQEIDWRGLRQSLIGGYHRDWIYFGDDFNGGAIDPKWLVDTVGSDPDDSNATIASGVHGGRVTLDTAGVDNQHVTLASGLNVTPFAGGLIIAEASLENVSAATLRAVEFGLSDAVSETNGLAFSDHADTPVAVAANAVIFGYDTDVSMTDWALLSVNDGGTPQYYDTGVAVGTSNHLLTLVLLGTQAFFYINDAFIAKFDDAVNVDVPLTLWLTLKTLSSAAKTMTVDFASVLGIRSVE